jgi:hypothetical protein
MAMLTHQGHPAPATAQIILDLNHANPLGDLLIPLGLALSLGFPLEIEAVLQIAGRNAGIATVRALVAVDQHAPTDIVGNRFGPRRSVSQPVQYESRRQGDGSHTRYGAEEPTAPDIDLFFALAHSQSPTP